MNKRQKIKKWFKDHFTKKNIINWLFVGLIALIVILCIYFENKDKETMQNKESNISIVNDNIGLKKDLLITDTNNYYSVNHIDVQNNVENYLNDELFNKSDILELSVNNLRIELNTLKNNLLSFNSQIYSVNLNNIIIVLSFYIDPYWVNTNENMIYITNYSNNSVDYSKIVNTPFFKQNVTTNLQQKVNYYIPINFDSNYQYLDIYYYGTLINRDTDELFNNFNSFLITNYDNELVNTLTSQNNALQERINNLEIQLDDALLGQDIKYDLGYQVGLNEGANQDLATNGFTALLNSIFSYPINFISNVFNFEFMGINVASILLFLVSIGVVLFVVKRLWK